MEKLPYSQAKKALRESRSIDDIKRARETIDSLGTEHRTPFEFPVASDLIEAYLKRKKLPYNTHRKARVYLSPKGDITYDGFEIQTQSHPTYIFGHAADTQTFEKDDLRTPSFDENLASSLTSKPSITNIVNVDGVGLVIFKAFLKTPLGTLARQGKSRFDAEPEEDRAIDEISQVRYLGEIFKNSPLIYAPKVLGRNGAVMAFEYIQGETVSDITYAKRLNKSDFLKIAEVLGQFHDIAAKDQLKTPAHFTVPSDHPGNSLIFFKYRTASLALQGWEKQFSDQNLANRYLALVEKAKGTIANNDYSYSEDIVYGDFKDENLIFMPDGRVALIDPGLAKGRRSMDIAKFCRGVLFKDQDALLANLDSFLQRYNEVTSQNIYRSEIAHMLGIDMTSIMHAYLTVPPSQVSQFPPMVKNVQDRSAMYFEIAEKALEGTLPEYSRV
ncbi:hypothetical protein C4568_04390 [Candidatus Parcubacteria bacterium]|nr:MAG: hypothetical protein C4568_04390 [Candidatus Parcubacteria bacterium]